MLAKTICALLGLVSVAALAQDQWQPATADSRGTIWAVNMSRLSVNGDAIVFWTRVENAKPLPVFRDKKAPVFKRFVAQWGIDCKARTMWGIHETYYAGDGAVVHSEKGGGWPSPIIPDSVGDGLHQHLCR